jgi:hypothetical protein
MVRWCVDDARAVACHRLVVPPLLVVRMLLAPADGCFAADRTEAAEAADKRAH